MARTYRVGVDIGGTFTDVAVVGEDGEVAIAKVASTPDDYARGVLDGLRRALAEAGRPGAAHGAVRDSVREVVHGTTVATNALLERRGGRAGLITTAGFRDLLEIRRMRVPRLYDLSWEKPPPLVERALRLEVEERLDHTGAVVRPLDDDGARAAIAALLREGVTSVAVCLLHAYANPAHEARIGALLAEVAPGVHVSLSHEVLPQINEYERLSTTVINAYVGPTVGQYLEAMVDGLAAEGIRAPLLVMQSNGGCMTAAAARRRAAHLVESGPAAGAIAAAALARRTGDRDVLALDMGGTTAKATLVRDGSVPLASEAEIGAGVTVATRLNRGGGYALSLPTVDMVEVGAGGGSILWVDAGGALQVGPRSAGAVPGPVCYASGGTTPTLTDANVALGYLNPEWLVGGALRLDAPAARGAIGVLAEGLGLAPEEAALGARRVAVAGMVRAVRAVSVERGHDPREATLVAFGGNGPLHAADVAGALAIPRVLIPAWPGLFSAFGLLVAGVEHHFLRTHLRQLDEIAGAEAAAFGAVVDELRNTALETLAAEGYAAAQVELEWAADVRYLGQSFELTVPMVVARGELPGTSSAAALAEGFHAAHARAYGHRAESDPIELVNVRLVARGRSGRRSDLPLANGHAGALREDGAGRQRRAYFGGGAGWLTLPVVGRHDLTATARPGPMIVEEYDATTLVPPGWAACLDQHGSMLLRPEGCR